MKRRIAESLEAIRPNSPRSKIGWRARAARLFGAAEFLRQATGVPPAPHRRADHDRSVAAVKSGLGEETFTSAWSEGRAMSVKQAVESALGQT